MRCDVMSRSVDSMLHVYVLLVLSPVCCMCLPISMALVSDTGLQRKFLLKCTLCFVAEYVQKFALK